MIAGHAHLVSWNRFCLCIGMCVCVCVFVWVSALEGINNHWCDMVWYRLGVIGWTRSTSFQFIAIDRLDEIDLNNTVCHILQASWHCTIHKRKCINYLAVAIRQSTSVIKVSGQMRSDKFKRRLGFSFTLITKT